MIDADFKVSTAVTLVARNRQRRSNLANLELADYLTPQVAREVFKQTLGDSMIEPFAHALSEDESAMLLSSLAALTNGFPAWSPYFEIGIRFGKLHAVRSRSTTSIVFPQHIYLGPKAFESSLTLQESLVHEYSHTWLNFLCELQDFQVEPAVARYTLPSGTGGKTPRGVLYAAHFAKTALLFYEGLPQTHLHVERMTFLRSYFEGCIAALEGCDEFSDMGRVVYEQLNR